MSGPKFTAINTKLRGMEARFLKREDYEFLMQADTVEDAAAYLKGTPGYREQLAKVDPAKVNRGELEQLLKNGMIRDIDSITKFFSGNYKKFFVTLYAKYEITDIKMFARRIFNNLPRALVYDNENPYATFIGTFSGVDPEKVTGASTLKELILAYQGTPFFKYLKPLLLSDDEDNLFRFETVLDLAYYSIVMKASEKLDAPDRELIHNAMGTIADLMNIQWIYRGMIIYRFIPPILYNYTISFGYKFSRKRIRDFCYEKDVYAFTEQLRRTSYAFLIKNDDTTDAFMERRLERYIYYKFKKLRRENEMSIIQAFTHITFLEYQMRDIITLIEVDKYHLEAESAKRYLIKYVTEGV